MSTFSDSGECPRAPIRPLTASTKGGKPYKRLEAVETEIRRMLSVHQSEWVAAAEDLHNETLVYLICEVQRGDKGLFGRLIYELDKRIVPIVRRWAQDFDTTASEEILWKVEKEILDLLVATEPSRQADYLEVAFGQYVKRRTINAVQKYDSSVMGRRAEFLPHPANTDDLNKIERPLEFSPDNRAGPQAILLEAEGENLMPELLQKAYDAVEDPADLELAKLYWGEGIPIECSDPNVEDLVHRCGQTRRQIQYRLEKVMKVMRQAIGVSK